MAARSDMALWRAGGGECRLLLRRARAEAARLAATEDECDSPKRGTRDQRERRRFRDSDRGEADIAVLEVEHYIILEKRDKAGVNGAVHTGGVADTVDAGDIASGERKGKVAEGKIAVNARQDMRIAIGIGAEEIIGQDVAGGVKNVH